MWRLHNTTLLTIIFFCFIANIYTIISFLLLEILSNEILILEFKLNTELKDGVVEFKKVSNGKPELLKKNNSSVYINNINFVNYIYISK